MHHASDSAAFVGGLAPHSVVLYDTILSLLREDEQDAVIVCDCTANLAISGCVWNTVGPATRRRWKFCAGCDKRSELNGWCAGAGYP